MPKSKFFQLLAKFAADPIGMPGSAHQVPSPQSREDWGYDLQMKLRLVLTEMEHELGLLKERGFDPEMLNLFSSVKKHLEDIYRSSKTDEPFTMAQKLLSYLDNRHTKAVLDNLEFLAKHHLEKTNVQFTPNKFMVQPKIRGFGLVPKLKELAHKALETLKPAELQPTFRPPSRTNMPAVVIPGMPKLPATTPLPPTAPESPEAKKKQEEEVG